MHIDEFLMLQAQIFAVIIMVSKSYFVKEIAQWYFVVGYCMFLH